MSDEADMKDWDYGSKNNRRCVMKKLIIITVLLLLAVPVFAGERVRGHWKDTNRDGVKDTYTAVKLDISLLYNP